MDRWNRVTLTQDQLQKIYRDWGAFYTLKQKLDIAAYYYDISLNIKDDPKAFYNRSRCKRNIAKTREALRDAKAAVESDPLSQPFNLEVCDAVYQLNEFEEAKVKVCNNSRRFTGHKLEAFQHRNEVLDDNFNDTLGETLIEHILDNEKYFYKTFERKLLLKNVDLRPLWKILKQQKKCDVSSILEEQEELISPLEIARRTRNFNVVNQIYMRRSWIDILFMKVLKNHPSFLLHQSSWTNAKLEGITVNKYDEAMKFVKMLHTRTPLYTQKVRKCPNKTLAEKINQEHLFRVQYQVHRNMHIILKKANELREMKKLEKLTTFVEEVMGEYVVLKTHRVMPWKFEFLNEIYNILGLAHIDKYTDIPMNFTDNPLETRFTVLLKNPKVKESAAAGGFVFGNAATYQDAEEANQPIIKHKKFLARMDKRLSFADHYIERTYLYHEIARSHLRNSRFDECCSFARRCIEEAKKCNSLVWNLLGLLLICKSHAVLHKIEKINETLTEALGVARQLNGAVLRYVELLYQINEENAIEKKEKIKENKSRKSIDSIVTKGSKIGSSS